MCVSVRVCVCVCACVCVCESRSLCLSSKQHCESVLGMVGLQWPEESHCSQFPEEGSNVTCLLPDPDVHGVCVCVCGNHFWVCDCLCVLVCVCVCM